MASLKGGALGSSRAGGAQTAECEGLWVTLVGASAWFWTSWPGALGRAELAIQSGHQPHSLIIRLLDPGKRTVRREGGLL